MFLKKVDFFKNSVFFQKFRVFQKFRIFQKFRVFLKFRIFQKVGFFNISTSLYIYIVYKKKRCIYFTHIGLFRNILFVKQCFIVIVPCLLYDSLILAVFHRVANGGIL